MTHSIHRLYCKHPVFSALGNLLLCFAVVIAFFVADLPSPILWLAGIFAGGCFLFVVLAVLKPGTTILIDDDTISRQSTWSSGLLISFEEVSKAVIERDPEASNYQRIRLETKAGQILLIDARFLNPDSDSIVAVLKEGLRSHGKRLVRG